MRIRKLNTTAPLPGSPNTSNSICASTLDPLLDPPTLAVDTRTFPAVPVFATTPQPGVRLPLRAPTGLNTAG